MGLYNSCWTNFTKFTKSQTKTYLPCAILISIWIISNKGRIQWNPRMNSMSHISFKFFKATSLFALSTCIFTIKRQYFVYIRYVRNSTEIHLVFTLQRSLFPFMFIRSTSFWNSTNFLGLCVKKAMQIL